MKGLVTIFVGLLIVYSLYLLSFTWFVNSHEKEMDKRATQYVKNNYPAAATKYAGSKDLQTAYQDTLDLIRKDRQRSYLTAPKIKASPGGALLTRRLKKTSSCWVSTCRGAST